jgi:hypothetical protein
MLDVALEETSFNYKSHGYYFRAGVDYNFLKNLNIEQYEMVFGGARLCYASVDHSAWGVEVTSDYWGKEQIIDVNDNTVQTFWLEIAGGVKAELFKNVFIGWSVRGRIRLYQTDNPVKEEQVFKQMDPVYAPGYGKGIKRAGVGFNYSVFYRLPLMHYIPKPKKEL